MVRLNLGSGDYPAEGWLNVDTWAPNAPEVAADLRRLPFRSGSVARVYCGHVLEHIDLDRVPDALAEVRRVLASDAQFCIVGPDYERAANADHPEAGDPVLLSMIRDGGDRWPGDRHLWLSTEATALEAVREVFPDAQPEPIEDLSAEWPVVCRVWWQFAIVARP